jgi:UDP-4-amino-4,6-dideoxy-N-acetyl-beta-L-altrosamine N-acetyltransferase
MDLAWVEYWQKDSLSMLENLLIRPLDQGDLLMVLGWRNDKQIRSNMLTQHEISIEEHKKWFARVSNDKTRCQMIIEDCGNPIGFVQFSGVVDRGVAEWSFHAAPGSKKGSGYKLGLSALNYAFGELKLHKVFGQVLSINYPSLELHARLGFTQEGVLRDQTYVKDKYISIIYFGLIIDEWKESLIFNERSS